MRGLGLPVRWVLAGAWMAHAVLAQAGDGAKLTQLQKAAERNPTSVPAHIALAQAARIAGGPRPAGQLNAKEVELERQYEQKYARDPRLQWASPLMSGLLCWDISDVSRKKLAYACSLNEDIAPQLLRAARDVMDVEPSMAVAYARGFQLADPRGYEALLNEVVERHPDDRATMEALFSLAQSAENAPRRVEILERIRGQFARFAIHEPPSRETGDASGPYRYNSMMRVLFGEYQKTDAASAGVLAHEMSAANPGDSAWAATALLQDFLVGGPQESRSVVERKFMHSFEVAMQFSGQTQMQLAVLQAEVALTFDDYRRFCEQVARNPVEPLLSALKRLGARLDKSPEQVATDLSLAQRQLAGANGAFRDFELLDYEGRTVRLSDLRGKVVLINFWFPSCLGCIAEFPYFQRLVERYAGRDDFVLLAINMFPAQDKEVLPLFERRHLSFTPLRAPDAEWAEKTYGITGAPRSFLLDADGKVVYEPGPLTNADDLRDLERQVEQLLR